MFGEKKQKEQPKAAFSDVSIHAMPSIFYGGNDPDIYHKTDSAIPAQSQGKGQSPDYPPKIQTKLPSNVQVSEAATNKKKKIILLATGIFVFLLVLGGIIWYYTKDLNRPKPVPAPVATVPEPGPEPELSITPDIALPTTTESNATSSLELPPSLTAGAELTFPPIMNSNTDDVDNDQLTDREEELFETDSGSFDTDKDGYFDGQEVFNLYNPKGIAPRRIIDSGLVREYANPLTNYRVYYPFSWQMGEVDTQAKHVLFSNISGDYVEVRVFDKLSAESFADWFARFAKGQKITDLLAFQNRFKLEGFRRRDDLVTYFVDENKVYVLIFHPSQVGPVAYRNIMKMMSQSFRYASTINTLEDQPIIPGVTAPTSSASTDTTNVSSDTTSTPVNTASPDLNTTSSLTNG